MTFMEGKRELTDIKWFKLMTQLEVLHGVGDERTGR